MADVDVVGALPFLTPRDAWRAAGACRAWHGTLTGERAEPAWRAKCAARGGLEARLWLRTWREQALVGPMQKLYTRVAMRCPTGKGKRLALQARADEEAFRVMNTTYGESSFAALAWLFGRVGERLLPAGGFVDVGCGTGKVLVSALLCHPFAELLGVELLPDVAAEARALVSRFCGVVQPRLAADRAAAAVRVVAGDMFDLDWSGAAMLYAGSTCFDRHLMQRIADKAGAELPVGAVAVSLSKPIPSPVLEVVAREEHRMSWGVARMFVHVRTASSSSAGGSGAGGSGEGAGSSSEGESGAAESGRSSTQL